MALVEKLLKARKDIADGLEKLDEAIELASEVEEKKAKVVEVV